MIKQSPCGMPSLEVGNIGLDEHKSFDVYSTYWVGLTQWSESLQMPLELH